MNHAPALLRATLLTMILCVNASAESSANDPYSPDNVRRFADYLFEQSDYLRAAGEYRRWDFLRDGAVRDSANLMVGRCYLKAEALDRAEQILATLCSTTTSATIRCASAYYLARVLYFQKQYVSIPAVMEKTDNDTCDIPFKSEWPRLLAVSFARQGNWERACQTACDVSPFDVKTGHGQLCSLVVAGEDLSFKSEVKAAALSAVIPGLGKWYAGRRMDAVYSFMIIFTNAWLSYRGFDRSGNDSVQGWIFGVLATTLYIGNVYGSAVSVTLHNDRPRSSYFARLEAVVDLDVP